MRDETARPGRRSSLRTLENLFTRSRMDGVIKETGMVTPTMKRIVITVQALRGVPVPPGRHIRVQIVPPLSRDGIRRPFETLRTYSVWDQSAGGEEIEIRAHLYDGDGIGLRWVREAGENQEVAFWGPSGTFDLRPEAPYHVFAGEETAAAAFGPLIRALGSDARVYGVLESESVDDEVPVPLPHRFTRVHRNGASPVSSGGLLAAMENLELPEEAGAACIAGEARTCRAIRDHLVGARSWPRTQITVKPFWTPGKRGLHT